MLESAVRVKKVTKTVYVKPNVNIRKEVNLLTINNHKTIKGY